MAHINLALLLLYTSFICFVCADFVGSPQRRQTPEASYEDQEKFVESFQEFYHDELYELFFNDDYKEDFQANPKSARYLEFYDDGPNGEKQVFLKLSNLINFPSNDSLIDLKLGMYMPKKRIFNNTVIIDPLPRYYLDWPNKDLSDAQLHEIAPYGIETRISADLFHQFVSVDAVHMILANFSGYQLPVGSLPILLPPEDTGQLAMTWISEVLGHSMLHLSNIRMHQARIFKQRGLDKNILIYDDGMGNSKLVSPAEFALIKQQYAAMLKRKKKGVAFIGDENLINPELIKPTVDQTQQYVAEIKKDYIEISIRGLSFEVTADYQLVGYTGLSGNTETFKQSGSTWLRVYDAVIEMKVKLIQDAVWGHPTIEVIGTPKVLYGKLEVEFDSGRRDKLYSVMADWFGNHFKNVAYEIIGSVIKERLPMTTDIVGSIIDNQVKVVLDDWLQGYGIGQSVVPKLLINDLRWTVEDNKIFVGMNVRYVDKKLETILKKRLRTIFKRNLSMADPTVVDRIREQLLDGLYKWRYTGRGQNSYKKMLNQWFGL